MFLLMTNVAFLKLLIDVTYYLDYSIVFSSYWKLEIFDLDTQYDAVNRYIYGH